MRCGSKIAPRFRLNVNQKTYTFLRSTYLEWRVTETTFHSHGHLYVFLLPPYFFLFVDLFLFKANPPELLCTGLLSKVTFTAIMLLVNTIFALFLTTLAKPIVNGENGEYVDAWGIPTVDTSITAPPENQESVNGPSSGGTTLGVSGYSFITGLEAGDKVAVEMQANQPQPDNSNHNPGWNQTPTNPCPNLHCLCSKAAQYVVIAYITEADPCTPFLPRLFFSCTGNDLRMGEHR